jgi:hypothetical protein
LTLSASGIFLPLDLVERRRHSGVIASSQGSRTVMISSTRQTNRSGKIAECSAGRDDDPAGSMPIGRWVNSNAFDEAGHARRLGLWQIDAGAQCSVIGTCLGVADLQAALRKHRLTLDTNASDYEIHSYCAHAAKNDCPLARTLTKLLTRRFAGAMNLVDKARTPKETIAVWNRLRDSGQIAAGYWAIMVHRDVAEEIKVRVFGEVHMLSHLHGRSMHQLAAKLTETQRRCADLEGRLARNETSRQAAMAERDTMRKAVVEQDMNAHKTRVAVTGPRNIDKMVARLHNKRAQRERALTIARARARQAETNLARIEIERKRRHREIVAGADVAIKDLSREVNRPYNELTGRRILYVGGRNTVIPHLRSVAESYEAEFQHHDGGIEDNMNRLADMIEGCDAVVCPIDCVSHNACQIAKASCLRLNKTFLQIPAASRSSFERALDRLRG